MGIAVLAVGVEGERKEGKKKNPKKREKEKKTQERHKESMKQLSAVQNRAWKIHVINMSPCAAFVLPLTLHTVRCDYEQQAFAQI